ncbi:glycosyl hydrolase [Clostridia bacterium]|nr:glycosyl hydrolase [Clostridia bacterium]GHV32750.1 glycosyl hydrolase [Clostridia bacterium]
MKDLTVKELARLCSGLDNWSTKPVESLGISSVRMTDGPHGLRVETTGADGKPRTEKSVCYPCACLLAASFDVDLAYEYGKTLALAARAAGADVVLAPGVNIKRSPLCGRNFEYLSEDPLLGGELGAAFINGLQENGVGAVLKHFALNNQEKARQCCDAICPENAKREIYFRPFEIAVKKARPWAVMMAYNKVDGEYCSQNAALIDVLRREWGYDGLVMSDWGGVHDRIKALMAGLDLEMPFSGEFRGVELENAANTDAEVLEKLKQSAGRVVDFANRAQAAKLTPTPEYDENMAVELARRVARESLVLLKNDRNVLPFKKTGTLAVIGAFAQTPRYQGGGAANVPPVQLKSFCEILTEKGVNFTFSQGFNANAEKPVEALIAEAVEAAQKSENVIIFAGTPVSYESEGYDRPHMGLPEAQNRLIAALAAVNPQTAVALFAGSAVEMPWIDAVSSVLFAYLPGQEGAAAIFDCVFGDFSPCGKLPETFPAKLSDTPCHGFFGEPRTVEYREGAFVGYRYYNAANVTPLFPFGHGLSYTAFEYSGLNVEKTDGGMNVTFHVTNAGRVRAAENAQIYAANPAFELRAFRKIFLDPNESAEIRVIVEAASAIAVGASSSDLRLRWGEAAQAQPPFIMGAAEFEKAIGRKVPEYKVKPFTKDSTLGELRSTFFGRLIYNAVVKSATRNTNAGEQEGQPLQVMLLAQAPYLTVDALITHSGGKITPRKLDGFLDFVNGRRLPGIWRRNK